MNHGWQRESTDRLKGGWVVFLGLQWLQWSPHSQLLDVVWCSAAVAVAVVIVVVAVVGLTLLN